MCGTYEAGIALGTQHPGKGARPPDRGLLRGLAFPRRDKKRCKTAPTKLTLWGGDGAKKSSSWPDIDGDLWMLVEGLSVPHRGRL